MLTISVKNLGPIAEGSVELKPLTIFFGPSNTGKSYMAMAVYAVATSFHGYGSAIWRSYPHSRMPLPRFVTSAPFDVGEETDILDEFKGWVAQQMRVGTNPPTVAVSTLPEKIRSWLDKSSLSQLSLFQDDVIERLGQIHGEQSSIGYPCFVRRGSQPKNFRLGVSGSYPQLNLEMRLSDNQKIPPQFDLSQVTVPHRIFELGFRFPGFTDERLDNSKVANALIYSVTESLLQEFQIQSYYLPAARSGIAQGHKVLAAALVGQSSLVGFQPMNIPTLPAITTEFLRILIGLDQRSGLRNNATEIGQAIAFIESHVLHGEIAFDKSAGLPYPEIVYKTVGDEPLPWKFALEHTSSMISELAPLILFLKYLVRPNNLLIIEEPESHLHPAAQLQLARGIARLVNAGVRVLITTHSSDFKSQIDNLISANTVSKETAESQGLAPEDCLSPEQVSAYGFRIDPGLGGSVVYPLPVDPDVGIEDAEFYPVAEYLYDQAIQFQRNRLT